MPPPSRPQPESHAEPAAASDLYGVPPDRFTRARDELVKRLRAAGEAEEAARVAKLRRPSAAAWALNQVARRQPDLVVQLLDAGAALKASMEAALGGDATGLREARAAERSAVDGLVRVATAHLESAGLSATDQVRQRLEATLRAAVVDDTVAGELREGTLERDHDLPGFGLEAADLVAPAIGRDKGGDGEPAKAARRRPEGGHAPSVESPAGRRGGRSAAPEPAARPARREPSPRALARKAALVEEADRMEREATALESAASEAEVAARHARRVADRALADAQSARRRADAYQPDGE